MESIYHYKSEKLNIIGTAEDIGDKIGVTSKTVKQYACKSYQIRIKNPSFHIRILEGKKYCDYDVRNSIYQLYKYGEWIGTGNMYELSEMCDITMTHLRLIHTKTYNETNKYGKKYQLKLVEKNYKLHEDYNDVTY